MATSTISMNFSKEKVVNILKENRAEHELIYNEAVEGYRKKFREAVKETADLVEAKLGKLKEKTTPSGYLRDIPLHQLTVPTNSLEEYDTVLEMLELTTDEVIVLNHDQYNCYMKDNWYWMKEFLTSNSAYSASAITKLSSMR